MVTSQLIELHNKIQKASLAEHGDLSHQFWKELFEYCDPTPAEFERYSFGVIINGGDLWELIIRVPRWDKKTGRLML